MSLYRNIKYCSRHCTSGAPECRGLANVTRAQGVETPYSNKLNIRAYAAPHKTPRPRRIANALNWNVSASLMLGQIFVR